MSSARITLLLGGARSGKSALAEKLAQHRARETGVLYLATLQPGDAESRDRIARHQSSRPASWRTIEAPFALATGLFEGLQSEKVVLLDCLTTWTGNLIMRESGYEWGGELLADDEIAPPTNPTAEPDYNRLELDIIKELEALISRAKERELGLILISNEVGMGLVPPYPMGRAYRDLLGRVNQRLAALADEVLLVVAGIPVDLKRFQAELF
jgi:adenosylcobinamide kinase/adenosylcobinamide-phosphate guanylyltransferase